MDFRLIQPLTSQTSFSLRFSSHLLSLSFPSVSNFAFSPLSIHALLALLTFGSSGATLHQLLSFLGSSTASDLAALHTYLSSSVLADGSAAAGPCLRYAGGVWVDHAGATLKSSFKEVVGKVFKAEAHPVPFRSMPEECRDQINKWVEQVTAGHIKDLFPPESITETTRVVLGNAIYFKGSWPSDVKFDVSDTRTDKFYLIDGNPTETLFMASWKRQFVAAYDGFKVLKLPYEQGQDWRQFSFYIFLPDTLNGLSDLSTKLGTEPDFLNRHIPSVKVPVRNFKIPKFKITTGINLNQILRSLGLVLPFQMTGDFSEMVDSVEVGNYYVSEIVHKCFVEVNEEGTEAAAASGAVMAFGSAAAPMRQPIDFVADHPFLFMIREDRSGVVLFVGHLLNPSLDG